MLHGYLISLSAPPSRADSAAKMPGSVIEEWRDERSAQDIDLASGKTVTMSAAQMMSLYCLYKRGEQALGHMMVGGIVVKPIQTTSKIAAEEKERKSKLEKVATRTKKAMLFIFCIKQLLFILFFILLNILI